MNSVPKTGDRVRYVGSLTGIRSALILSSPRVQPGRSNYFDLIEFICLDEQENKIQYWCAELSSFEVVE